MTDIKKNSKKEEEEGKGGRREKITTHYKHRSVSRSSTRRHN
jgi:hypothetical protein